MSLKFLPLLLALANTTPAVPQSTPPWSKGANDSSGKKGYDFVGAVMDVTPRHQADVERERLQELQADLAHITRMTTMGFVSTRDQAANCSSGDKRQNLLALA